MTGDFPLPRLHLIQAGAVDQTSSDFPLPPSGSLCIRQGSLLHLLEGGRPQVLTPELRDPSLVPHPLWASVSSAHPHPQSVRAQEAPFAHQPSCSGL